MALVDSFARRAGIDVDDLWSYLDRRKVPPPAVRDAMVAAFFPLVPPDSFLPSGGEVATLATDMQAPQEETRRSRVSRARLRKGNRRHPFVAALVANNLTVTEFARELGYARSTVQSWYDGDSDNARPIPKSAANAIKARLGVPVTAWAKVTD